MAEAVASLLEDELAAALVLASRHWHLGVVGIVAARLVDRFQRPAIVMAINEQGIAKGSARTIGGFDLYQGLALSRAAGGLWRASECRRSDDSRVSDWRSFVDDFPRSLPGGPTSCPTVRTLQVDAEVRLDEVQF